VTVGIVNEEPKEESRLKPYYAGVGVALGAGAGTALGVALDNIAVGVAVGAGVGVVLGAALSMRSKGRGDV
jgi:uncharacterized membrane protein